jgi:general stress protein CsbA
VWPQIINTALGIWLMAAPAVLNYGRPASTNDYIIGPLAATFACIAIWEATRPVRWVNLPLGLWLIAAPLLLDYTHNAAINSVLCGIAIAGFSCLGGAIQQRFGDGWSALWRDAPAE